MQPKKAHSFAKLHMRHEQLKSIINWILNKNIEEKSNFKPHLQRTKVEKIKSYNEFESPWFNRQIIQTYKGTS